jgi:hypothetical protein
MKIPSKINILGFDYEIIETDDKNLLVWENDLCDGLIKYNESKIYVKKSLNEQVKLTILIHEVLHGIDYYMSNDGGLRDKLTEDQIHQTATGLASIILNKGKK